MAAGEVCRDCVDRVDRELVAQGLEEWEEWEEWGLWGDQVVADLEQEGYLVREKVGRRNRYNVNTDCPFRHPIESHRMI